MVEKIKASMNRNEYFEWKKEKVKELAKTGMKVADIARELNMGEEDMYSFLSRNFGGVRRLRESVGVDPDGTVEKPAVLKTETVPKIDIHTVAGNVKQAKQQVGTVTQTPSIIETFRETLRQEKQNILEHFKEELMADRDEIIEEVKANLENTKHELLEAFQNDVLNDLTNISKSL